MSRTLKILKWSGLSLAGLILLVVLSLFVITTFFGGQVKKVFVNALNNQLATELIVGGDLDLNLFTNFPNATLSMNDVQLRESYPGSEENFIRAGQISLKFNLMSILKGDYTVKKIFIKDAFVYIHTDTKGNINYKVWKTPDDTEEDTDTTGSAVKFSIQQADLENVTVRYADETQRIDYEANINEGRLKGDFSADDFTLAADLAMNSTDQAYNQLAYLNDIPLHLDLDLDVNLNEQRYTFKKGGLKLKDDLIDVRGMIRSVEAGTEVDVTMAAADISLGALIALLPEGGRERLDGLDSKGELVFDAKIKGLISSRSDPTVEVNFALTDGSISYEAMSEEFTDVSFSGSFTNGARQTLQTSVLQLSDFSADFGGRPVKMDIRLQNLEQPLMDLNLDAALDLEELSPLIAGSGLEDFSGTASFEKFVLHGNVEQMAKGRGLSELRTTGRFSLTDVSFDYYNKEITDFSTNMLFANNDVAIDQFALHIDDNDFSISGNLRNLVPFLSSWLFEEGGVVLDTDLKISSKEFDLDEILDIDFPPSDPPAVADKPAHGERAVPSGKSNDLTWFKSFRGKLLLDVGHFNYDEFEGRNISGYIEPGTWATVVRGLTGEAVDGRVVCNGKVQVIDDTKLAIEVKFRGDDLNIYKLFRQCDDFGQSSITAENLGGTLATGINLNMYFDKDLVFMENEMTVNSNLIITDGELVDYDLLNDLAGYVKVKELEHIKFLKLTNDVEIADGRVHIPAMTIRSTALNIKMTGDQYFDDRIEYYIKVNMMELLARKFKIGKTSLSEVEEYSEGPINLYIVIKGTVDNPIFSTDRKLVKTKLGESLEPFQPDKPIDWEDEDLQFFEWDGS